MYRQRLAESQGVPSLDYRDRFVTTTTQAEVYVKNNTSWAPGPPGARQNALQEEPIFIKSDFS